MSDGDKLVVLFSARPILFCDTRWLTSAARRRISQYHRWI